MGAVLKFYIIDTNLPLQKLHDIRVFTKLAKLFYVLSLILFWVYLLWSKTPYTQICNRKV